jgi:hypothetical protein
VQLPVGHVIYQTTENILFSLRVAPDGRIAVTNGRSITVTRREWRGAIPRITASNITGMDWSPNGEIWFSVVDGPGQASIFAARPGDKPRPVWRGRSVRLEDIAADGALLVVAGEVQGGALGAARRHAGRRGRRLARQLSGGADFARG